MVKVKICGLTRPEDIDIVNALKPDYIGFVFAESRRRLTAEEAGKLSAALNGGIKKVGVFVNAERETVKRAAGICGLDIVQLHGDERPEDCIFPGLEVWKALRIREAADLRRMEDYRADRFLLDAYVQDAYGGSGTAFNWDLLANCGRKGEIVLAGGLSPENVEAAIRAVRPYAVDVSSGVETAGYKDYRKVKEFMERARKENA
jgi:phosphoribosylanthranilate isomerase